MSENKGISKARIGLIISTALVGVLLISNVGVYVILQKQISSLRDDRNGLQNQLALLQSDFNLLNASYRDYVNFRHHSDVEYNALVNERDTLQSENQALEAPQLNEVNFEWSDNHPWLSSAYVHVEGTLFNSGTYAAYNVIFTVKIMDSASILLKSEDITLGTMQGKNSGSYKVDISYSGDASYLQTKLSFTP